MLAQGLGIRELGFNFRDGIMDMDRLPVDDGTPMHYPAAENYLLPQGIGPGDRPTMGDEPQGATIKAVDYSIHCLTKPCGTFCHHIQHWLQIGRRAGYHAQNIVGSAL